MIDTPSRFDALTPRERQIASMLARGRHKPEIATELGIATKTVDTHVTRIMGKLGVNSSVQLTLLALRAGFVGLEDEVTCAIHTACLGKSDATRG